ncbi:Uncharacterised protein [Vibrio cholerae]|nr:Uncharacterised protein [Vibrio cholerae]
MWIRKVLQIGLLKQNRIFNDGVENFGDVLRIELIFLFASIDEFYQ